MGDRWVTFDCFGTIVDWNAGARGGARRRCSATSRAATLIDDFHDAERDVKHGGGFQPVPRRAGRVDARRSARPAAATVDDDEADVIARALAGDRAVRRRRRRASATLRERGFRLAILTNCDDDLFAETRAQPAGADRRGRDGRAGAQLQARPRPLRGVPPPRRSPTPGCTPRTAGCTTSSRPPSSACPGSGSIATAAATTRRGRACGSTDFARLADDGRPRCRRRLTRQPRARPVEQHADLARSGRAIRSAYTCGASSGEWRRVTRSSTRMRPCSEVLEEERRRSRRRSTGGSRRTPRDASARGCRGSRRRSRRRRARAAAPRASACRRPAPRARAGGRG